MGVPAAAAPQIGSRGAGPVLAAARHRGRRPARRAARDARECDVHVAQNALLAGRQLAPARCRATMRAAMSACSCSKKCPASWMNVERSFHQRDHVRAGRHVGWETDLTAADVGRCRALIEVGAESLDEMRSCRKE
jgi:hypothetical protein